MKKILSLVFAFFFFYGCSDYEITKIIEKAPDIHVTPEEHDFENVNAVEEVKSLEVVVSNLGNVNLDIYSINFKNNDPAFSITSSIPGDISPGESFTVQIEYDPLTYEINEEYLVIISNDEDEPKIEIPLNGIGDSPVIQVTPDLFSFDDVYVGCEDFIGVIVSNVGNVDLVIDDIQHFSSLPADFYMVDYEPFFGSLPITIPAGGEIYLDIYYAPEDALSDIAYVEIHSNDPVNPIVHADHLGDGDYEKWNTESFEQNETTDVDILFVIDNSGSMGSNQSSFKSNFSSFISVFAAAGVDYRIAFITTDSPDFVDGIIVTPADPDPVTTVNGIVDNIGTRGSAMEKGLEQSYKSTSTGPAAPGRAFFREDAKLVVIYVSDEPDRGTTMTPTEHINHFRSLKSDPRLVIAHAVAGDYPSGCTANGGAEFGDRYYDVVGGLGGTFLSICSDDWGIAMDTLARESVIHSTFSLIEPAIDGTIEVVVNGYTSTDWYYESSINAVQFHTPPPAGSSISITYAVWSCIEES